MALGSSLPEIIMNLVQTVMYIDDTPDELGAFTIVGSAAFNLLVISAVSIMAVDEPKKVLDMGVFVITGVFSMFAYVWLLIVLAFNGPDKVSVFEAWMTIAFYLILMIVSYFAAKYNEKMQTQEEDEEASKDKEIKKKKQHLRNIARTKGEEGVIDVALDIKSKHTEKITDEEAIQIRETVKEILGKSENIGINDVYPLLQPDTLFERFAARKQNQVGATKDFLDIKGQKGMQMENTLSTSC